jgi:hypothetical protein
MSEKKNHEKYLLCRPSGGLNDTLNQIDKCIVYAKKFNRTLVLDSLNATFSDKWNNYFTCTKSISNKIVFYDDMISQKLSSKTCFPHSLKGKITSYKTKLSNNKKHLVEKENNTLISFDFKKEYSEDLIIHHQFGGGNNSFNAIQNFTLLPSISKKIQELQHQIGSDYISIHIRGTETLCGTPNFRKIFDNLEKQEPKSKILFCTDDYEIKKYAQQRFKQRIFFPSSIPDTKGTALHMFKDKNFSIYERNTSTIIDLCMLALGKKIYNCDFNLFDKALYFTKKVILRSNPPKPKSGFSRLAKFLHENPRVLSKFIFGE